MGQQQSISPLQSVSQTSTVCSDVLGLSGTKIYQNLLTDIQSIATNAGDVVKLMGQYYNTEYWQLQVDGPVPNLPLIPAKTVDNLSNSPLKAIINTAFATQPGEKPLDGSARQCDTDQGQKYGFMAFELPAQCFINLSFHPCTGYLMVYTPFVVRINPNEHWKMDFTVTGFYYSTGDIWCASMNMTGYIPALSQNGFNRFITSDHPQARKWRSIVCYCGDSISVNPHLNNLCNNSGYRGSRTGGTAQCDAFFTDDWCTDPTGKPECACITTDLTEEQKVLKAYQTTVGQNCPQLYSADCASQGYQTAVLATSECPNTCINAIQVESGDFASVNVEGNTIQVSCGDRTDGSVGLAVLSTCSPACGEGENCVDGKCTGGVDGGDTGTGGDSGTGDGTGTGGDTGTGDGTGDSTGTTDSSSQNFWEQLKVEWNKLDDKTKIIIGASVGGVVLLLLIVLFAGGGRRGRRRRRRRDEAVNG